MQDIKLNNEYVKEICVDDTGGSESSISIIFQSGHQIEVYLSDETVDFIYWGPNPNHQEGGFITEWNGESPRKLAELSYEAVGIKQ